MLGTIVSLTSGTCNLKINLFRELLQTKWLSEEKLYSSSPSICLPVSGGGKKSLESEENVRKNNFSNSQCGLLSQWQT